MHMYTRKLCQQLCISLNNVHVCMHYNKTYEHVCMRYAKTYEHVCMHHTKTYEHPSGRACIHTHTNVPQHSCANAQRDKHAHTHPPARTYNHRNRLHHPALLRPYLACRTPEFCESHTKREGDRERERESVCVCVCVCH